jgi:hypothetical protein
MVAGGQQNPCCDDRLNSSFFASVALQFHPHMIRREVVTVMDVEEVAGHGHSGI